MGSEPPLDALGDTRIAPLLPSLRAQAPRQAGEAAPAAPSDAVASGPGSARPVGAPSYPWERGGAATTSPAALSLQLGDPGEALPSLAEARARDKELGAQLKDLRAQRKALRDGPLSEAAGVHQRLLDTQAARESIRGVARNLRWEQAGGRAMSPTYQTYFQHSDTPVSEMQEVLRVADDLGRPDSPYKLKGNRVDTLTREEIWQKKMDLLEGAARQPVREGKPVEIEAQYYEMASPDIIEKLGRASRGGARVRVLLDPGMLSKNGEEYDANSLAARLNTVRRLEVGSQGQASVQFFANREVLGGRAEIMHRKLLRVGEEAVFGGMNSGAGSGENVDFAVAMQGSGARRLSEGFQRDLDLSRGRSTEQIYGSQLQELREQENVTVQRRGLVDLLEAQGGAPPRVGLSSAERVDRAVESASFQGVRARDLAEIPDADGDGRISDHEERRFLLEGRGSIKLTEKGRNLLADGLEQAVKRMNAPRNQEALSRSNLPEGRAAGQDTLAVGDSSAERQAMVLHAIDSADRFVKVSAFVMNEDLARLLADKKDRMQAEGKPFEVQVVLDPGTYSYGGTPNEKTYKYLEDRGVPVRWAVLDRTDPDHDRKVHAKLMVTDKLLLTGSTNFSNKALRDNWEASEMTFFNDGPDSQAKQQEVVRDFDRLWERESMGVDTRALAAERFPQSGPEGELQRDTYRTRTTRAFLRGILNYEQEVGGRVQEELRAHPELNASIEQRVRGGEARGYAITDSLGQERMQQIRQESAAYQRLEQLQQQGP